MLARLSAFLLYVVFIFCDENVDATPFMCFYAAGKPPGQFQLQQGSIKHNDPPIAVHNTADQKRCKFLCTLNKSCWYVEVRRQEQKCYFYDKDSALALGEYTVFYWEPCAIPGSCKQLQHRCKGFWLERENVYASGPRVIKTMTNIQDARRCRTECLSIPVCESINIRNIKEDNSLDGGYCDLLYFSPQNRSFTINDTSLSQEWHCCPHTDDDLPKVCRNQKGKCRGWWKPKPNEALSVNGSIGQVRTMSKFDCMSFCDNNPYCRSVYFNQRNATCILRGENLLISSNCVRFDTSSYTSKDWFVYEWTCCDPKQDTSLLDQSDSDVLDARCVCLNATSVGPSIIATDGCTKPLTRHNVTIESPMAAFWLTEDREVTANGRIWTRVFNGEIYLWVARALAKLHPCPKHRCDIYSTVIDAHAECPRIIPRSEWYSRPPRSVRNFTSPPPIAIILNTVCPEWGCYSKLSCSDYMRQFQYFHQIDLGLSDIAYNFVVGEDGNVYEGRGPNVVGSHTLGWNSASEGIAMIGWFENRVPKIASLRATRLLLRCMASRSQINKFYQVFAHRDLRPTSLIPGRLLYELLPNWHFYYRTKLPPGPDCESIFFKECLMAIIFCLMVIISFTVILIGFIYCAIRSIQFLLKNQNFRSGGFSTEESTKLIQ